MNDFPNVNSLWAGVLVEELVRLGVDAFYISPGSRSAPLATAAFRNGRAHVRAHYDERGAAFAALGHAKAANRPAALICTSGTAAANYLPAVVEASMAHVPLILLTADRPPELLQCGANQAIQQRGLYGEYARWESALPCPGLDMPLEALLTTVDQAVYRARRAPAGPVHLNCMFREPLAPLERPGDLTGYLGAVGPWRESGRPYTVYEEYGNRECPLSRELIHRFQTTERGVIVAGAMDSPSAAMAVRHLAGTIGWPVFPDITSDLRLGHGGPPIVAYYDLLLLSQAFQERFRPDTVIHIGGPIVSKRLAQFLEASQPDCYVRAAPHPERRDPQHQATHRIESGAIAFCRGCGLGVGALKAGGMLTGMAAWDQAVDEALTAYFEEQDALSEPLVCRMAAQGLSAQSDLFLGNSMPVRAMDMFAAPSAAPVRVHANRGASGIDGNVAAAAGVARANGAPLTAILGDLTLLHDLNSLALFQDMEQPVALVVVNNDGGGIFSFLPIADFPDVFEPCFGTPHGMEFRGAAEMFGLRYAAPDTPAAFMEAYAGAMTAPGATIIETRMDRAANRALYDDIHGALRGVLEAGGG